MMASLKCYYFIMILHFYVCDREHCKTDNCCSVTCLNIKYHSWRTWKRFFRVPTVTNKHTTQCDNIIFFGMLTIWAKNYSLIYFRSILGHSRSIEGDKNGLKWPFKIKNDHLKVKIDHSEVINNHFKFKNDNLKAQIVILRWKWPNSGVSCLYLFP